MNIFGKSKTPQQELRENKRALDRVITQIDREKTRLENEQVKLTNQIKKSARENQMESVRIMAKDMVRTRNYVKKLQVMRANVQAISLKITTLQSTGAMSEALKKVTATLKTMDKQISLPKIQKILMEFEKESMKMDMKEEIMSDTMNDIFDEEGDEEASNEIVNQVLDELGIEMTGVINKMPAGVGTVGDSNAIRAPSQPVAATGGTDAGSADADADDLEERLKRLKRN